MKNELSSSERKKLAALVRKLGVVQVSKTIGCNRSTIANALAGLPIQAGTIALITNKLRENFRE